MKLPVVSCAEMRRIEEQAFAAGSRAEELMENVGRQIAQAVAQYFPPATAAVFYGKGHNGGDALVAARHLRRLGWDITLHPQEKDPARLAALTRQNLEEFSALPPASRHGDTPPPVVVLDGLLGLGASGPLRAELRALAREINALRQETHACVFAIDLPTGLDGDSGQPDPDCVVADFTIAAGYAKTGLLADQAPAHVGRLCVAPLREFEPYAPAGWGDVATPATLRHLLPPRNFDSHKTQFGRVGLIAGSLGLTGAAVLCAQGALHGGAGLVTLYATRECYPIIAVAAPPEVMVRPVADYREILQEKHDVIGLGPGLGQANGSALLELIEKAPCPMVVDADGLNLVAKSGLDLLARCAGPRLLTPHPGEMARLFPESKSLSRPAAAAQFLGKFSASTHPVTLLLKGSRTLVQALGEPVSYNTTGHPGMGSGGMGDVLTGLCSALIGQHLSPFQAARLGSWLTGRAAELAIYNGPHSPESLSALSVVSFLGPAFRSLTSPSFPSF